MNFVISLMALLFAVSSFVDFADAGEIYLSPNGNDTWSGRFAEQQGENDGPLATLQAAIDRCRVLAAESPHEPMRVILRGGRYDLSQGAVELNAAEFGAGLSFEAYAGETPLLAGSRSVDGWEPWRGRIFRTKLADDFHGETDAPSLLFEDGKRLVRARTPNVDSESPYRGGFYYVERGLNLEAPFSGVVGQIPHVGDTLKYKIDVPVAGEYQVWIFYGAENSPDKIERLDGRMSVSAGNGPPVVMTDLVDTGNWTPSRWGRCAKLTLSKGKTVFSWRNDLGGGIDIAGFVLTNNTEWVPEGVEGFHGPDRGEFVVILSDQVSETLGPDVLVRSPASLDCFQYRLGDIQPQWCQPGVELRIFQSAGCRAFLQNVEMTSVEPEKRIVHLGGAELLANLHTGDRYFLENHLDFLDAPGEWYFDSKERYLYLWPLGLTPEYISASLNGTLVRISGESAKEETAEKKTEASSSASFCFSGLTFMETGHTRDDGCHGYEMGRRGVIELDGVSHVTVQSCRFLETGRYAARWDRSDDCRFERCVVERSGQGGVLLLNSARNRVVDSIFRDMGFEYKHIGCVVLDGGRCFDNLIAHNEMTRSSRYAVTIKCGGDRNRIEFNDISDMGLETYDTGAIEVTQYGRTHLSESVIRNNRIRNTVGWSARGSNSVYMSWGIYLDSFAGGYIIENNYVSGTFDGGFMCQGGQGNELRNNIFLNGLRYQGYFTNFDNNAKDLVFENNIVAFEKADAMLYLTGYHLITPDRLHCDGNYYWCGESPLEERADFARWRQYGFDVHSTVVRPEFLHPENEDGQLVPDSPILRQGFQQIDFSSLGPRPPQ